jgi:hypothetical protein
MGVANTTIPQETLSPPSIPCRQSSCYSTWRCQEYLFSMHPAKGQFHLYSTKNTDIYIEAITAHCRPKCMYLDFQFSCRHRTVARSATWVHLKPPVSQRNFIK